MKKRILTLISAFILAAGIFTFPQAYVFAEEIKDYEFMAEVLSNINVFEYKNYQDASKLSVNRGEFAIAVASIMKISDNNAVTERYYVDVPSDHWAAYAVNYLAKMGFVSVGSDKMFRPGDSITANEALKILLEASGYGQYALAKGGYPVGYIQTANNLRVPSQCYSGEFTYAKAVYLVYEIMNLPVYEISRIENGELLYSSSDETMLSLYFGMYEGEGVVTAIEEIAVNDVPANSKNGVVIDGVHYKSDIDLFDDLGRYTRFVYIQDDENKTGEIVVMSKLHFNDRTLEISTEDFESFDSQVNQVTYYDSNNKIKRIKLAPNAAVIKNGKPETENTLAALSSNKGNFRFTDADANGSYEYVFVFEYVNYVVDFINSNSKEIYDTIEKGRKVSLDDNDRRVKIYNQQGMPILFDDIKPRSVISVLESDMMVTCYVSTNEITATIFETTFENNVFKILAGKNEKDTQWYTIDKDLYENYFKNTAVKPGTKAVLYTDFYGKIAYAEQVSDDVWQYAYLIDTYDKKEDSNDFKIYVYTQNNEQKAFALAKNVKIDGVAIKEFDKIYPALKKSNYFKVLSSGEHEVNGQLIRIKINNEGIVSEIDTERSVPQKEGTANLNRSINAQKTNYVYGSQCFDGKMVINNKTVIFGVPVHDKLADAQKEDFSVFDVSSMIAKANLMAEGFKINADSGYEDAVVIYDPEMLLEYKYDFYLVENIKRKATDGGERTVVSAWSNGVLYDLTGAEDYDFVAESNDKVDEGDLIQIMRNLQGDIYKADILYDYSRKDDSSYKITWNSKYADKYNDYGNAIYGYLTKYSDGVMNISYTKPDSENPYKYDFIAPQNKVVVMIYDSTAKKPGVYFGSESDIIPADRFGDNAKPYFFCTKRGSIVTVIIYK